MTTRRFETVKIRKISSSIWVSTILISLDIRHTKIEKDAEQAEKGRVRQNLSIN
jgi:hypothetical protein